MINWIVTFIVLNETFPRALIVRSKKSWILHCKVQRGVSDGSMVDILQVSGSRIQGLVPPPVSEDRWSQVPMSSLLPDMITTEAESWKETVQTSAPRSPVIYA